ncbi:Ohr family peroxiredoxin [Fulvivirga ulvae]|uniref:Ohr family peroxiredoxin n=1 Tax=Fulvivirga ulvae TaxID=2904245 RepID=UPI001F235B24|nr:Ohr family peroxiredoxin [Fulvivirga ulvae]UII32072.1 Ohr family peroxiredoxin [Fulvivirga ulvae]
MKPIYTAEVTAQGGRDGNIKSQDGNLNLQLAKPESMGGDGSAGANPEQLFAAAYGPCFLESMKEMARHLKVDLSDPKVIVKVSFHDNDGKFHLSAALNIVDEAVEEDVLTDLVKKTHQVCPYSKATRGNIEIILTANKIEVEA